MEERWRKSEPLQFSSKERRSIRCCSAQPVFIVELEPKPAASHGVVCGGRQISLHEMRKKQKHDQTAWNL